MQNYVCFTCTSVFDKHVRVPLNTLRELYYLYYKGQLSFLKCLLESLLCVDFFFYADKSIDT